MIKVMILGGSEKRSEYGFKTYEIRRLLEEAKKLPSVDASYFHVNSLEVVDGVLFADKTSQVEIPDIVMPRALCTQVNKNWHDILNFFEKQGALSINSARSISLAGNKIAMGRLFDKQGVPYPQTIALDQGDSNFKTIGDRLGFPLIVKQAYGTHGVGVAKVDDVQAFRKVTDDFWSAAPDNPLLGQACVLSSHGRDVRAFVIGECVVASMLRRAADPNEFRSNYTLGGNVEPFDLPQEAQDIAVAATKALGLKYSGVDLLFAEAGYVVCEANKTPDFKGMEKAYPDINIARQLLEHAISLVEQRQELCCMVEKSIESIPLSMPILPVFSGNKTTTSAPAF